VLQNRQLCYYAFSREKLPVKCDNMTYLGITEGLYDSLVLALSKSDANENIWMTTVRALEKMVGHEPPDFRIAGLYSLNLKVLHFLCLKLLLLSQCCICYILHFLSTS
jgi:hypothetical protein